MKKLELYYNTLISTIVTIACLYAGAQIGIFSSELALWRKSVILDLDSARRQFINETRYMYFLGCKQGIEYPPEYRIDTGIFNPNSPVEYCNRNADLQENYLLEQAYRLGKPYVGH